MFHNCGKIDPILEDLPEVGVKAIWPQLPAYNMKNLASRCRSIGLTVAIHTVPYVANSNNYDIIQKMIYIKGLYIDNTRL